MFEELERIRKRRYTKKRRANCKITKFPKQKLLEYAVVMAIKYSLRVYFVNSAYTSRIGEKLERENWD